MLYYLDQEPCKEDINNVVEFYFLYISNTIIHYLIIIPHHQEFSMINNIYSYVNCIFYIQNHSHNLAATLIHFIYIVYLHFNHRICHTRKKYKYLNFKD